MKKSVINKDDGNALLLRASAKRLFETLMEQTADRIYIKDKKGRFIAASRALAEMHNLSSRHELEGKTDFDLFAEAHAKKAYEDEQKILKTGIPMINRLERETHTDGSITWASSNKAPLYLNSGILAGIIGISRDVTAERNAQEQLAEREQRLSEQNKIMRSDYESAHKVQSVMIPGRVPVVQGIEIGYLWKPMTSVGGDILNFPRNPENLLLFYLGDVCGHGVTAAFYTVLLKYLTAHSAEVYHGDPKQFLNSVNEQVTGRINQGFVTGLAGHFGKPQKNGDRTLVLAHSGNRQVMIYRKATKKVELIELPVGMVMGIPGGSASSVMKIDLQPGDRFYAYTDGIVESSTPDGAEFGNKRLIKELELQAKHPVSQTIENVFQTMREYTQVPDLQDDITLLGLEIK